MTIAVASRVSQIISLSDADDPMIGYVPLRALYTMFSGAGGNCTEAFIEGGYTARVYWQENTFLVTAEGGRPVMLDGTYAHLEVEMIRQTSNRQWPFKKFKSKADHAISAFADYFRCEIYEQSHHPTPLLTMLVHADKHEKKHWARLVPEDGEYWSGFYLCGQQGHGIIADDEIQEVPLNPFWP